MARFTGDSDKMKLQDIDNCECNNLCVICKVDLGPNNPRQLCRKTFCENEGITLCRNMDCVRLPPDWDFEEDTKDTYQEGQWKKCCLCDGYFDDNGLGDILFIEESPNNKKGSCDLCKETNNIVQMKGTGQYICQDACDESDDESDDEYDGENDDDDANDDENEYNDCYFNYYICKFCDNITCDDNPNCIKCKKEMCMDLYQTHCQSDALNLHKIKKESTVCSEDCACDSTCNNTNDEEVYKLRNTYKKSIYQTEQWKNVLENGKKVCYEVTTYFRWGTFEVELSKKELNELLLKDEIILNDIPGCCVEELSDGCDRYEKIVNENNYSEEELKEIHHLLFFNCDDPDSYDSGCDSLDEDILDNNGWSMDDTIYGISSGGCTLEVMSD